jgi:hypothetical protein
MDISITLNNVKSVVDAVQTNWDIISVIVIGIVSAIKGHNISKFIRSMVVVAEMSFEKVQAEEKLSHVLSKINAKYPITYLILGNTILKKLIGKAVTELQEHIGTTSERLLKQATHLQDIINKDIIENTKEITAKILASNITKREFFGDFNLVSNEQVHEELRKLLDGGEEIVNRINSNTKAILERVLGKLNIK